MSDSMTPSLQRKFTRSLKMLLAEMENVEGDLHQARVILADSGLRTDCPGPNVPRDTAEFDENQPSSPGANLQEVTVKEQVEEKEAPSNPPSSSQHIQQEEIKALFSTFSESIKDALDKTLSEISQVKKQMITYGNELKVMKAEQAQLAEAIKGVNNQLNYQGRLQSINQSHLIKLKDGMGGCTARLNNINAEFTELKENIEKIPGTAGVLPSLVEQFYNIITSKDGIRLSQKLTREFPKINMYSSTAKELLSLEDRIANMGFLKVTLARLLAKQKAFKDLGLLPL